MRPRYLLLAAAGLLALALWVGDWTLVAVADHELVVDESVSAWAVIIALFLLCGAVASAVARSDARHRKGDT